MNRRTRFGREGEDAAVRLLEDSGYAVIARNVRLPGGEVDIIARDREWNDQAARKQLLLVFEAAGPASEVARQGRRRLSAILFS